jgi:single-stranded-DNA-specific exonuclease
MTTDDAETRARLADRLHQMNAERQAIEEDVQAAAITAIEQRGLDKRSVIVVAGEGWHQGVIGIVAGRLKDRYDRPTVVIGIDGYVGKGSARSISGVDLGAAVRGARDEGLLVAGGGHAMAAGLTVDAAGIQRFADFLEERLRGLVEKARAARSLLIDSVIAPSAVSGVFAAMIDMAAPFGPDNPEPTFVLASMRAERTKIVGANHISCDLVSDAGDRLRAIAFRAAGEPLGEILASRARIHVAGKVKADHFRGGGSAQFQISDAARAF